MAGLIRRRHGQDEHQGAHAGCVTADDLGELESMLLAQREEIIDLRERLDASDRVISEMRTAAAAVVAACDQVRS